MNEIQSYKTKYMTATGEIELTAEIIRKVLAIGDKITDEELFYFMKMCEYQKLNPFVKEAYLIKMGKNAQMVVGIDVFTNRLNNDKLCEGWHSGIQVINSEGKLEDRKGQTYLPGEKIVGAWFSLNKKGWKEPFYWSIPMKEYLRDYYDKDAQVRKPMKQWAEMPAIMIVKCVIAAGCRKAIPSSFTGLYAREELPVDATEVNYTINEDKKDKNENPDKIDLIATKEEFDSILEAAVNNFNVEPYTIYEYTVKQMIKAKLITLFNNNTDELIIYSKDVPLIIEHIENTLKVKEKQLKKKTEEEKKKKQAEEGKKKQETDKKNTVKNDKKNDENKKEPDKNKDGVKNE